MTRGLLPLGTVSELCGKRVYRQVLRNVSQRTLRLANQGPVPLDTQPDVRNSPHSLTGTNVFEIIFAGASGLSRWQSDVENDEAF